MGEKKERKGEQDYLRVIYELYEKGNGRGVRSIDIAKRLGVSKASVSEMLRKLAEEKLIKLEPYSDIFPTTQGWRMARELSNNCGVIKSFFKKYFGYDENKAYEEAHKLEHSFSNESIERMREFLEGKRALNMPNYVG